MVSRVPSLNWLRVFEAAARTQSFARAAGQLNMSAAAVSQQVKALESHVGAALFERYPQSVRLTEAGRAYLPAVAQALGVLEVATEGLFGAPRDQPLYVQSVLLFAQGILAQGLGAFQAAHPRVQLMLTTGNSVEDFARGFQDLRIVFGGPDQFGGAHDPLIGETLWPVALPGVAARTGSAAALVEEVLIEVPTHRAGWDHVLAELRVGPGPRRMLYADSTIMAASLAAAGAGVMLARSPASDVMVRAMGLVPCLDGVAVPGREMYHLVYPDRAGLRPAAAAFRGWLLDHVAALPGL